MFGILDRINDPSDVRKLNISELRMLCSDIREYMVDCCSRNPGHLASSLGAVELIVGYHYVFNTPKDKIIFDVGHQAYAHKILTGRKEAFRNTRTKDGLSGFPNMTESGYDNFGVGHSSTSISAALGLAEAARMLSRDEKVTALIGDGALTGGLAFEGLNNAGASKTDLLVMLNDNNQSIDSNRGALHNYLLRVTTSQRYNTLKDKVWNLLGESRVRAFIQRWIRSLKSWFVKKTGGDIFESLGIRYFGPVDGNDIEKVVSALRKIGPIKGPRIIHFITTKGKGYAPAEQDPVTWHAPGRFDPSTGKRIIQEHSYDRYQDVFGQVLLELAEKDPKVVGITPAMASGCGMSLLARQRPEQFYDVGIEEEHAVTFSAGLAAGGMKPFCNIYSSFSQRAYDQIIHDVALQKMPVVLCFDRAGLVGEDGATHQGAFDMAAYRSIPDLTICSPKDEKELKNLMYTAYLHEAGPIIIRYPRGCGEGSDWRSTDYETLPVGKAEVLREGDEIAVVATGPSASHSLKAARAADATGGRVGVYNFRFLKPLDTVMLDSIASRYKAVLTVEDGSLKGGLFSAVAEYFADKGYGIHLEGAGIPDRFIHQARQAEQRQDCGIDEGSIEKRLQKYLQIRK